MDASHSRSQPQPAGGRSRPLGQLTRGTTAANRLRRMDRWIAHEFGGLLMGSPASLVIDVGFGNHPTTTIELTARLRRLQPGVQVIGLDIDSDRVRRAQSAAQAGLNFQRGGFELGGLRPLLVRTANVLRQYPETAVGPAWARMQAQLLPDGAVIEGTSDEFGRRCTWVHLARSEPISLSFSCSLKHLDQPSDLAERLVKGLIHRNRPGQKVHRLLQAMDAGWRRHSPLAVFGPRQRWQAMCADLGGEWPVLSVAQAHRLGELTVAWSAVAPDQ